MRQRRTSGAPAVPAGRRRLRCCAALVVPALLVTACTSHRTTPAAASSAAADSSPVAPAAVSPATPLSATPPPAPAGLALPAAVSSRLQSVDSRLPGGQLARCLQTTPDGTQLLCESRTAGAAGTDPMTAMIALSVRTGAVTVLRRNTDGEQSDLVDSADADSTWIVWVQDHDGRHAAALVNWTIYIYDRATHAVHVVSAASAVDVANRTAAGSIQPRLANGRVWWAATVSGRDGTGCTCTYSAPAAGGAVTVETVNTSLPQPVRGHGVGPEGTTVYAERPSGGDIVVGAQLNSGGQAVPMVSGDVAIAGLAAGAAGLIWQTARQPSELSFAAGSRATPTLIGSGSVRTQLAVGDRYAVWAQSSGAMLYDTQTGELYQTTIGDSVTNANGSAVMWGAALDATSSRTPDTLALRYSVITDPA
jgi:hypothetical protein